MLFLNFPLEAALLCIQERINLKFLKKTQKNRTPRPPKNLSGFLLEKMPENPTALNTPRPHCNMRPLKPALFDTNHNANYDTESVFPRNIIFAFCLDIHFRHNGRAGLFGRLRIAPKPAGNQLYKISKILSKPCVSTLSSGAAVLTA